ncbi:MAG: NAD(P)/FAD-dependent oxidoreductase [Chitinophagales bacterium]|nr:NAD(P)/FAD-dependent oxidoreductase [Chitinophagales bacterium]MCB9022539.1 NAD(P)/FAD-dependent oxidoreductase [Chitinophagales bacterium]HAE35415.1 FAD-dependent oxidoreductase [Bacteroidota bacterium]HQU39745.1 NAD(P)/FAD-dependent oxidoreductase [Chitinophagales bacterium]
MAYHYNDDRLPTIVVIGGGFAGLELVKKLNNKPFRVILIDKRNYHTFQPLLYQVASAGLSADSIGFPFRKKIGPYPNIAFRMAEVQEVDPAAKKVITNVGTFLYDHLVIATGTTTNYFGNKNLASWGLPLKSIGEALDLRSEILQELEKAIVTETVEERESTLQFVIVGGGPTGVELAGALAEIQRNVLPTDYTEIDRKQMKVVLIEAADRLLATMSEKSSKAAKNYLEKLGVEVRLDTRVQDYDGASGVLQLADGGTLRTRNIFWTAGVKADPLPGIPAENIGRGGRYLCDTMNRITGLENVYALGDTSLIQGDAAYPNGHPQVAQVAIQQAHRLASNFLRWETGKKGNAFSYKDKGSMATIGRHKAVVDLPGFSFSGYFAWYIWMFIHLMALVGFRNRFMVFMNWMWNYFTYDKALRLIVRPYKRPQ